MKLAVTTLGKTRLDLVDQRFGRAEYILIFDENNVQLDCIEQGSLAPASGAGIAMAQKLIDAGIDVLITGHLGPNAWQVLSASDIRLYEAVEGTADDQLSAWHQDALSPISAAGQAHRGRS